MKRWLRAACCVATLMIAVSARANWGGYESGNAATGNVQSLAQVENSFRPAGLAQVEMQSELLQIHLHIESADVEVDYTFHNPGDKPVNVTAGFPTFSRDSGIDSRHDARDVSDYHLFVDGKETPWKLESQPPPAIGLPGAVSPQYSTPLPYWFVSTVPFAAGETHAVRIRYQAQYSGASGGVEGGETTVEATTLGYELSTAAGWMGGIGKGRVVITADTANADEIKIRPEGRFHRDGNTFAWEFSALKPTLADDITVQLREGYARFSTSRAISKDRPEGSKEGTYVGYYEVHAGGASYWINQNYHVTATSSLDPKIYGAENLAGYENKTWAEGVPGDGIGEGLDLTLDRPSKLYEIGIINGFNKSRTLYQENNRVAELSVSINGGKDTYVTVPDEFLVDEPFWFPVAGGDEPVKTIRLRIEGVYQGTKYQDTCISKIYLKTKLAKKPKIEPSR